jgi:hypothetical protein
VSGREEDGEVHVFITDEPIGTLRSLSYEACDPCPEPPLSALEYAAGTFTACEKSEVFSLELVERAVELLNSRNVPTEEGYYIPPIFLSPLQKLHFELTVAVEDLPTYRARCLVWELYRQAIRAHQHGRGLPTAREVLSLAMRSS